MYKLSEYLDTLQKCLEKLLEDHKVDIYIANHKIEVGEPPYILLDTTNFGYGRTLDYYSVNISVIFNAAGLDDDLPAQLYAAFRFLTRFVLPNFIGGVIGEYSRERGGRIYTYNWAIELPWDKTLIGGEDETEIRRIIIKLLGDAEGYDDIIINAMQNE